MNEIKLVKTDNTKVDNYTFEKNFFFFLNQFISVTKLHIFFNILLHLKWLVLLFYKVRYLRRLQVVGKIIHIISNNLISNDLLYLNIIMFFSYIEASECVV